MVCGSFFRHSLVLAAMWFVGSVHAETGVNARILDGREIRDITGARYKCKLVENESPYIIILFGFHRVWGPNGTYMLESNLYADGLQYQDGVITTWPMKGTHLPATASLRAAVQDYDNPVHCGAKTLSPEMFPRQTYLVDGIPGLWKTDMISQINLNGYEFQVEVSRRGLVRDYEGWQGAEPLARRTIFREWQILVTIDGITYTNSYAVPEDRGAYLCWYECLKFCSEFFWRSFRFKALLWEMEIQREHEPFWRRANEWYVCRQDDPPIHYGVRLTRQGSKQVIEVSNVARGEPFMDLNTIFDLSLVPPSDNPPDLVISSATIAKADLGSPLTIVTTLTNLGEDANEPFEVGYFLSTDEGIDLDDTFMQTEERFPEGLPAGECVTLTSDVVLPDGLALGQYYVGVWADYRGVIAESDNDNNIRLAGNFMAVRFLPAMDEWQLPRDFALEGWIWEEFPDTRRQRARTSLQEPTILTFAGTQTHLNGSLANTGPIYTGSEFFPYVMLDVERQWLLLHPSPTHAASVGFAASRSGTYRIAGAFARANTFINAGNGVTTAIARNKDVSNPLFMADIPSSSVVSPSDPFSGYRGGSFDLSIDLMKGDIIRFLVFNGPAGNDIGFDVTALHFRIAPPARDRGN